MKIQPSELEQNGFELQDSVHHKEMIPFIQIYLKKRTRFTLLYIVFNGLALVTIGSFFGYHIGKATLSWGEGLNYFSYGVLIAFLLIPLHEFIHVVAYRSQGAQHTSYDVNWKKFYFLALADQFVANRREFIIVALAPFVVISTALLLLLLLAGTTWQITILGIYFTHTACCSGDFGLLSYFDYHKSREVVTYDDVASNLTYFWVKNR